MEETNSFFLIAGIHPLCSNKDKSIANTSSEVNASHKKKKKITFNGSGVLLKNALLQVTFQTKVLNSL